MRLKFFNKNNERWPPIIISYFQSKIIKDYVLKYYEFYKAVFPERNLLENIHKKFGFWGTYPLLFTFFGQSYDKKIIT